MVNMSKLKEKHQPIQVFVRLRPCTPEEESSSIIDVRSLRDLTVKYHSTVKNYSFDRVFGPDTKQVDVYKLVAEPTVSEVLAGYNCTILAYGQTGTGKTYTMIGEQPQGTPMSWGDHRVGLIPRTLSRLFNELRMQTFEFSVRVSYLELYNEELFDLLSPVDDNSKLKLYDDNLKKGSVIVQGLSEVTVTCETEVCKLLQKGAEKRRVAATLMNASSSRSHTVFCVTVHTKEAAVDGEDLLKTGKLYLVDLAGSENIKQSGATDLRAREAASINTSLLTLGRCITKLIERSGHIPYRESKLTRLLQDSLGGRTKTSLIATVSPLHCNGDETMNTLDYASRAKCITNKPEINQRLSKSALLKEYTTEIERLKKELIASRTGTGIFVDRENYDAMLKEVDTYRDEMKQKINVIKLMTQEKERVEATCTELQMSLTEHTQLVEDKNKAIEELSHQLTSASEEISYLREDNIIKDVLIHSHDNTEKLLQETTRQLLQVADITTADTEKLHDKLDSLMSIFHENKTTCEQHISNYCSNIQGIKTKIEKLHKDQIQVHLTMLENVSSFQRQQQHYMNVQKSIESHLAELNQLFTNCKLHDKDTSSEIKKSLTEFSKDVATERNKAIDNFESQYNLLLFKYHKFEEFVGEQQNLNRIILAEVQQVLEYNLNASISVCAEVNEFVCNSENFMKKYFAEQMCINNAINENIKKCKNSHIQAQKEYDDKLRAAKNAIEEAMCHNALQSEKTIQELDGFLGHNDESVKCYTDYNTKQSSLFRSFAKTVYDYVEETKLYKENKLDSCLEFKNQNMDVFNQEIRTLDDTKEILERLRKVVVESLEDTDGEKLIRHINELEEQQNCRSVMYEDIASKLNDAHALCQPPRDESVISEEYENVYTLLRKFEEQSLAHEIDVTSDLEHCKERIRKLFTKDLKEYRPTGETPERTKYKYPRVIPETKPREVIIEEFKRQRSSSMSRLSPSKIYKLSRTMSGNNLNQSDDTKPEPLSENN